MRPGNTIAAAILTIATSGLASRAAVALSHERPTPASATPGASTIDVAGFSFPTTVNVTIGGTLTWVNRDSTAHTVTFAKSPTAAPSDLGLEPGGSATATFRSVGTFQYLCQIHPSMTGRVEVVASAPTTGGYR